jgi:hypothetical protein
MFATDIIVWGPNRQPDPSRYTVSITKGSDITSKFDELVLGGSAPDGWNNPANFKDSSFALQSNAWMRENFPEFVDQIAMIQKRVEFGY